MNGYDLDARVPRHGAPTPDWVSRSGFERQLVRVHGKVPDPTIGLYGPDSMMWRIGRNQLAATLGAGRALLLQIAHPWVTQGVDHHSLTRDDPIGRGRRTFTNVLAMTHGSLDQAFEAARRVHIRHAGIRGRMDYDAGAFASGTHYQANEANAMVWVHATLWETLMHCYELVVGEVSAEDKERYYQETKLFAYLFGIPDEALPPDWPSFMEYNERMWTSDMLKVTPATRELTAFLFAPLHPALAPAMKWMEIATAALLPERLRRDFGFRYGVPQRIAFQQGLGAMRLASRVLPEKALTSPTYYEALARIEGRRPDLATRVLTRAALGQWELVA